MSQMKIAIYHPSRGSVVFVVCGMVFVIGLPGWLTVVEVKQCGTFIERIDLYKGKTK